jgi:hypothetical protein
MDPNIEGKRQQLKEQYSALNKAVRDLEEDLEKEKKEDEGKLVLGLMEPKERDSRKEAREALIQKARDRSAKALQEFRDFQKANPKASSTPSAPVAPFPAPSTAPSQSTSTAPSTAPAASSISHSFISNTSGGIVDRSMQKKKQTKQQREILEAAQKKKRRDYYDQPFLTDVPKIQLKVMGKMLKDCLDRNTFNNLAKPVDPKIGDLYIYKCGAIPPVHAIDSTNWKHSHTDTRTNQLHFPGRILDQITYIRRDDLPQKKVILFDSLRGLVVVHYR